MSELKLSPLIISSDDVRDVMEEIETFKRWYAHNSAKQKVGAKKDSAPPELSQGAKELITAWQDVKPLSAVSLDQLLDELEKYLRKAPRARITLAAAPSRGLKEEISSWCRSHISESMLIDFRFNSVILGGMIVSVGSHTYDWSFRRQILDSKAQLLEVIARV